ncbi:hypothetical protein VTO42DRAFT_2155 [Malbranchea cinnamomea]
MSSPQNGTYVPATQSSLSFTQGFILGQLSVILFIGAFIKFFIFGEAPPSQSRRSLSQLPRKRASSMNMFSRDSNSRSLREKPSTSNILRPVPSSSTNTRSILRKTYYNAIPPNPSSRGGRHRLHHSSHQPESLDWFNVLVAQTIAQYRQTAYLLKDSPTSSIPASLMAALNNPDKKPSFIDKITVTDISLGEEFPIFSNCRVIAVDDPNSDGGRLQALMDVDLSDDNLSLAIETSLILNYPKPYSAVLPVALSVSVVRFSGTLCISFVPGPTDSSTTVSPSPPPSDERSGTGEQSSAGNDGTGARTGIPKTSLAFSFLPDYRLDLSVRSLIGSRSRLQDVPKVAQLVEARVQAWFEERVVEPRVQVVALPGIWPRMGRTGVRGQEEEMGAAGDRITDTSPGRSDIGVSPQPASKDTDLEGVRLRRGAGGSGNSSSMYGQSSSRADASREEEYQIPGSLPGAAMT